MKSRVLDFINRWRHTLGYGVHSPLAFRIVKECVHPDTRYAYYADSIIQSYSESAEMHRQLRLIVRLVSTLHLKNVWMPDCSKKILKILRKSCPSLQISTGMELPKNPDFIVLFPNLPDAVASQLPVDTDAFTILWFNQHSDFKSESSRAVVDKIENSTLTLDSSLFSLYIRRKSMSPVCYSLL